MLSWKRLHETVSRWKRHFLRGEVPAEQQSVVKRQWGAMWIGLALCLQSLSGLLHILTGAQYDSFIPSLLPLGGLFPFPLLLGSFWAIGMACRAGNCLKHRMNTFLHTRIVEHLLLILTLAMALIGIFQGSQTIIVSFLPVQFLNDGMALDTNAAVLLIQGRNPYTDSRLQDVARQLQLEAQWVTPLRRGRFAGRLDYPPLQELQTVLTNDLQSGSTPEFESDVSSPALCFLSLVPLLLWHMENVVPFSLLCYLLLVLVSWWQAPPLLGPWVALLALANVPMWSLTMGNPLELFCMLLITLAWLQCEQRWSSALLLGLAVASKQLAWFFLPFYLVLIWRQEGLREALHRLSMAGGVALVFNLPFLLWNWQAWVAGVLAPMADPLFPLGVGLIDLSIMHVLPFFPTWVYLMLEGLALMGGLACYWRWCPRSPEIAMMLAILPLVFAWRSLPSYFAGVAYPLFILLLGRRQQEVAVA